MLGNVCVMCRTIIKAPQENELVLWVMYYLLRTHTHAIFHGCKNCNFQMKNYKIFLIFTQNIDCGYTLEQPH